MRILALGLILLTLACSGSGNERPAGQTPVSPSPTPAPAAPAPTTITQTFTGTLSAGDTPCISLGIHNQKPCRIHAFTPANSGTLTATLTWPANTVDLDLELWRGTTRIINTLGVGTTETISSTIQPGLHELHVVYYQGPVIQTYTLTVTRPN